MQKLIWIGSPFFAHSLKDCGWPQIFIHNFEEPKTYCWNELVQLAGFEPDVLVVADKSRAPFVLGMEKFPCLTVFYSVDSHIHSWEPMYAQGFDACLVSLQDHIPLFIGPYLRKENIWWSPPFAKATDLPNPEAAKIWDCLFVGSNDAAIMPKRAQFLAELGKGVPNLKTMRGNYRELFPQSRVLVNQAEHEDLNFRVFEAMGCGGCLVTPRVAHGLSSLFVDGEHFVYYAPHDAGDAAYKINFLLENPDLAEYIAQTGYEEVNAKHRAIHRAQALTDHLCDLYMEDSASVIRNRINKAKEICENSLELLYLLWAEETPQLDLKAAYLAAAKGKYGLNGINA